MHRLLAVLFGLTTSLAITLSIGAFDASKMQAQFYNGGGLEDGIGQVTNIQGPISGDPETAVVNTVNSILNYVALIAVIAIIVAGLYLLLSGGSQKDKAKEIVIYTIVGLALILLAKVIVLTVYDIIGAQPSGSGVGGIGGGTLQGGDAIQAIVTILNSVLDYVALIAVIAIIIAGLYLIFTGGSQKDRAKEIVIYTIVGLVLILIAKVIVLTVYNFLGADNPNFAGATGIRGVQGTDIRATIISIVDNVLNFLGLIAVVAIIIAGLYLIFSFGNDEGKDKAKNIVIYTVAGLILILLAKLIVALPLILIRGN